MKCEYHRHLPHQIPAGFPIFLTWNLKGALPQSRIELLQRERARLEREPTRKGESKRERAIRLWKALFIHADSFLDTSNSGPLLLREDAAAEIVENAIIAGSSHQYTLWSWCVMANHVHVLLTPQEELAHITQILKGATSYAINCVNDAQGRIVWQDESYDHWARHEAEMLRIIHYIENNPTKAGLCAKPADWKWSSAKLRDHWPIGTPYVGQASA